MSERLNDLMLIAEMAVALDEMADRFEQTLAATHATGADRTMIKRARKLVRKANSQ